MGTWIVTVTDPGGRGQNIAMGSTAVYCDTELQARVDGAEMLKVAESAVTVRQIPDTTPYGG